MRRKVNFLRPLHEMSGVHESRLSLPKHIGRKNRIAIGLVLHLESYIRIIYSLVGLLSLLSMFQ